MTTAEMIGIATFVVLWSSTLVYVTLWLTGKLSQALPAKEYAKRHNSLVNRVGQLETWALRLNGSVPVDFAEITPRDYVS